MRLLALGVFVAFVTVVCVCWPTPPAHPGPLVLMGGGPVSKLPFLQRAGGSHARILVVPTASRYPTVGRWPSETNVRLLHAEDRLQADVLAQYLPWATGVWFSGGDQGLLADRYAHTAFLRALRVFWRQGGVIGGTSAGASIVSDVMIYGPDERHGFALTDVIVDQHFDTKHRLPRLLRLVDRHPGRIGLGLDETTVVVLEGKWIDVLGPGQVCIVQSNLIRWIEQGERVCLDTFPLPPNGLPVSAGGPTGPLPLLPEPDPSGVLRSRPDTVP